MINGLTSTLKIFKKMDTINDETPVGSDGATPSQDTASNDTQPAESTDSVSDGEVEEVGEAPELLAGKYATQEELIKAHQELERKLGEQGQKAEVVNLLEKQTGMTHQQIKDYLANQQRMQMEQQIRENPGMAAFQEVQQLKDQLALQNEEKELDKFLSSEEGKAYTPFKDKILKLGLNLERDKSYDEIAKEYFGQSRAQGQQDAYKKIETKKNSQATSVSKSPARGKITLEELRKMTAAEQAAILPHSSL